MKTTKKTHIVDDAKESISLLIRERLPWLLLGLIGGVFVSFIISRFEVVLSENISLAFFLPFIVYMSDAVGTQTENVYVRSLAHGDIQFHIYLIKECVQGILLGGIFGSIIGIIAFVWLHNMDTALTVGLSMFYTMAISPVMALLVPELLFKGHRDPALGAGPFTTIIQNLISVVIYFSIASMILFK